MPKTSFYAKPRLRAESSMPVVQVVDFIEPLGAALRQAMRVGSQVRELLHQIEFSRLHVGHSRMPMGLARIFHQQAETPSATSDTS